MQTKEKTEPQYKKPLKILISKINLTNNIDQDQFIYSTQFNIKKSETYIYIMQDFNTIQ